MTESPIVTAISHYLTLQENLGRVIFIRCNTGAVTISPPGKPRRFMRFGKPGAPDFLVWVRSRAGPPETLFLEVKTPDGRQNENQKAFQARVVALGGFYAIIRSVDEAAAIVAARIKS